nr:hypothetical protein [Tanacetum cinerariifolium]
EMKDLKQQYLDEMKRLINSQYRDEIKIVELKENFNGMSIEINKKEKLQQLEQWANLSTYPSKHFNSFCYDDDDEDYTIAVTPSLSTKEPDNSLSMGDEHLDTIPSTESDEFIKSSVENLIPIPRGIDDDILLTIKDDILRKKLLNINLLIAKNEALNDNPTPSSDFMTNSGSTTYSANSLLEEFTDELALITYPPDYDDNLQFDIESGLKEIEFLLYQGKHYSLKDSIDLTDLANLDDNFVDPIPEMFTDEHTLHYSSSLIFDVYDDDFLEVESNAENDFSRVDALPSTNNEDKVFNPGILIQEEPIKIIIRVVQDKKLAISNASLVLEDFDPPLYEPLFFKEDPNVKMLLPFSSENEEKLDFQKPDEDFSFLWKEHSYLGCSSFPFLSPLISSSMGELGQAQ